MRIILSHGKVNIFNLAKNAGTSVEQIERFYAKHLPLSREMAKNLQSFGEELAAVLRAAAIIPWAAIQYGHGTVREHIDRLAPQVSQYGYP